MKPHVVCHMMTSIDGRLAPDLWTRSPDGTRSDWSSVYARVHDALGAQGWIVGRVTMAEMAKAAAHPPATFHSPERPFHFADRDATSFAIALDPSGKLHFDAGTLDGDHLIVLLGADISDSHLAELAADGVSYIVAGDADIDLGAMLEILAGTFGISRLALEGGGGINGSFLSAGLVDEISLLVAPAIDGRNSTRSIIETGDDGPGDAAQLSLLSADTIECGLVHLRYAVRR